MGSSVLHIVLSAAAIGLGMYLYAHPILLRGYSNLVRGVIIWIALVLALRFFDFIF